MPSSPVASLPLSEAGRAAHDIGLAGLLGGNLFGRHALHPSVTEISDPAVAGVFRAGTDMREDGAAIGW